VLARVGLITPSHSVPRAPRPGALTPWLPKATTQPVSQHAFCDSRSAPEEAMPKARSANQRMKLSGWGGRRL
jgi:hypothetical protein